MDGLKAGSKRLQWLIVVPIAAATLALCTLPDAPGWTVEPLTAAKPNCPADFPVLYRVDEDNGVYVCMTEVSR